MMSQQKLFETIETFVGVYLRVLNDDQSRRALVRHYLFGRPLPPLPLVRDLNSKVPHGRKEAKILVSDCRCLN